MSGESLLEQSVDVEKAARLRKWVWILTVVVLVLVALMRSPTLKIPITPDVRESLKVLPGVIALINTLVAACLLGGLWAVFRKNYKIHQRCMTAALILSILFLLCYVAYHFSMVETKFGDSDGNGVVDDAEKERWGMVRSLYLGVLFAHIAAAAISFPMILMTFVHAWTRDFDKHRKLAKKTFPLWMFVAVSGPFCYWMLKPFY